MHAFTTRTLALAVVAAFLSAAAAASLAADDATPAVPARADPLAGAR